MAGRQNELSIRTLGAALLAGALCAAGATGALAQGKTTLVIAGESGGGVVNAVNTGVAKIVSQHTPLNVRVRGYSAAERWLPELNNGRIDFGTHFAATAWLSYNQIESKLKLRNMRLLRSSRATTPLGFMVRADSDIKSVADLRGKRVAGGYGGHPIMRRLAGGMMSTYGLAWSDVRVVPVPHAGAGAQALIDGRIDAAWFAVFTPLTRVAHSRIGVRFLSMDMTPERLKAARETIFPGIMPLKFRGNVPWAPRGTGLIAYEYYVLGSTHTDDASVKTILGALWDHDAELRKIHPVLRGFTNDAAVSLHPVIPYHPAAIAFYKAKGVWSAEAEAANNAVAK